MGGKETKQILGLLKSPYSAGILQDTYKNDNTIVFRSVLLCASLSKMNAGSHFPQSTDSSESSAACLICVASQSRSLSAPGSVVSTYLYTQHQSSRKHYDTRTIGDTTNQQARMLMLSRK